MESSEAALEGEFEAFFRDQPAVSRFVMELASHSRAAVGELALYLAYVAYKALTADGRKAPAPVTSEAVAEACSNTGNWIHAMTENEEAPAGSRIVEEPHLVRWVISEVEQATEQGLILEEEEKGVVYFILGAVITSLSDSG